MLHDSVLVTTSERERERERERGGEREGGEGRKEGRRERRGGGQWKSERREGS